MIKRFTYPIVIVCAVIIITTLYFCIFNPLTTVILVRHAEKAAGSNPPLTEAGHKRAGALAHVVQSAGVDVIFVTDKQRTQQTADSVEAQLGLTNVILPEGDIAGLVQQIKNDHIGETVLVVGHSHTLPDIIDGLGISPPPTIPGDEFDNLFVIHRHRWGPVNLTHLRYGHR